MAKKQEDTITAHGLTATIYPAETFGPTMYCIWFPDRRRVYIEGKANAISEARSGLRDLASKGSKTEEQK